MPEAWRQRLTDAMLALEEAPEGPAPLQFLVRVPSGVWHRALTEAMWARGWNQTHLARHLEISGPECSQLLRLHVVPTEPVVLQRLMALTGQAVDDLFPAVFYDVVLGKPQAEGSWRDQWQMTHDPAELALLDEKRRRIDAWLTAHLSPKEARVLSMRHGLNDEDPLTLDDMGQIFGVSRERIRQIETHALRKLHHPTRLRELQDITEFQPYRRRGQSVGRRVPVALPPLPPPVPSPPVPPSPVEAPSVGDDGALVASLRRDLAHWQRKFREFTEAMEAMLAMDDPLQAMLSFVPNTPAHIPEIVFMFPRRWHDEWRKLLGRPMRGSRTGKLCSVGFYSLLDTYIQACWAEDGGQHREALAKALMHYAERLDHTVLHARQAMVRA